MFDHSGTRRGERALGKRNKEKGRETRTEGKVTRKSWALISKRGEAFRPA